MVKETEINLPKSYWPGVDGGNLGLVDKGNRLVQIGRAGRDQLGYMYEADEKHIYLVAHHSVCTALARTMEITLDANGTVTTALVLLRDPTRGYAFMAARSPEDYVNVVPDWTATGASVNNGDTVSLLRPDGPIKAQVTEANWMPDKPDNFVEVRGPARALISRLGLAYSREYLGAPFLNMKGGLTGFVDGPEPETRSTIMVSADGFRLTIANIKKAFTQFTAGSGNSFDQLHKDPAKYDRMRTALAPYTRPTFFGIETITTGRGRYASHTIVGVPTSVNIQTGQLSEQCFIPSVDIPNPTPANSNLRFMEDFNRYRSVGYGKLSSLSWLDQNTRQRVEIKPGDEKWEVALDIVAPKAGDTLTVGVNWVVHGGSTTTALYYLELNTPVQERLQNGENITRWLSALSPNAGLQIAKYYRFTDGTVITTLDAFVAGQAAMATYSGGGGGYNSVGYAAYLNRPYRGPSMGYPGDGYFPVWNKGNY